MKLKRQTKQFVVYDGQTDSHIALLSNYSFGTIPNSVLHTVNKSERPNRSAHNTYMCVNCVHSLFIHSVVLSAYHSPPSVIGMLMIHIYFFSVYTFFCSFAISIHCDLIRGTLISRTAEKKTRANG